MHQCLSLLIVAACLAACSPAVALHATAVPPAAAATPTAASTNTPTPTSVPTAVSPSRPTSTPTAVPSAVSLVAVPAPTAIVQTTAVAATTSRLFFYDSQGQIAAINPDGRDMGTLTNGPNEVKTFALSPDHRTIAFSQTDGDTNIIGIVGSDGSNATTIASGVPNVYTLAWSPDATRLAFVVTPDPYYKGVDENIYVIDSDGSTMRQLTSDPLPDVNPVWSPDGTQIAFERGNYEASLLAPPPQVWVMQADGSDQRSLAPQLTGSSNPRWSADGQQLTLDGSNGDQVGTFTMTADGSQSTWNGPKPAVYTNSDNQNLSISPDGQLVVFVRSDENCQVEGCPSHISLANADGSAVRQLTFGDRSSTNEYLHNDLPVWSPDSTQIAFQSNRDGYPALYTMNIDGAVQQRVTTESRGWVTWRAVPTATVGNPSGTIAASVLVAGATTNDIFLFPLDGSQPVRVSSSPANDSAPAWSLDGKQIAFISDRDGGPSLYRTNTAGTTLMRIAGGTPAGPIMSVAWSPDGRTLVYDQGCEIRTVKSNGSAMLVLVAVIGAQDVCFSTPRYAPDGQSVLFAATLDSSRSAIFSVTDISDTPTQRTEFVPVPGSEQSPALSPDGTRLAFVSARDGAPHIYVANADGTNPQRLTTSTASEETWPTWSPDGRFIACTTTSATGNVVAIFSVAQLPVDHDTGRHFPDLGANNPLVGQGMQPAWRP